MTIDCEEPKSRSYIREWKRRDYEKNSDKIKAKNKAYYYKNKFGLNNDDMKKYDIYLPLVAKILNGLEVLNQVKPELVVDILHTFNENQNKNQN
jgi:hypothetical protein